MPGLPFQSKLEPHYDFIVASRKKRMTWQQIADAIRAKEGPDFTCTRQAVQDFYKRKKRRPYAMGMEPNDPEHKAPSVPADPPQPASPPEPTSAAPTEQTPDQQTAAIEAARARAKARSQQPEKPKWDFGYDPTKPLKPNE